MILLDETQRSFYNLLCSLSIGALEDLRNVLTESNFVEKESREKMCLSISRAINLKKNYSERLPYSA